MIKYINILKQAFVQLPWFYNLCILLFIILFFIILASFLFLVFKKYSLLITKLTLLDYFIPLKIHHGGIHTKIVNPSLLSCPRTFTLLLPLIKYHHVFHRSFSFLTTFINKYKALFYYKILSISNNPLIKAILHFTIWLLFNIFLLKSNIIVFYQDDNPNDENEPFWYIAFVIDTRLSVEETIAPFVSPLPNDSILDTSSAPSVYTSSEPSVYTSRIHLLDMDRDDLLALEITIEPFKFIPDTSSELSVDTSSESSFDSRDSDAGTFFSTNELKSHLACFQELLHYAVEANDTDLTTMINCIKKIQAIIPEEWWDRIETSLKNDYSPINKYQETLQTLVNFNDVDERTAFYYIRAACSTYNTACVCNIDVLANPLLLEEVFVQGLKAQF